MGNKAISLPGPVHNRSNLGTGDTNESLTRKAEKVSNPTSLENVFAGFCCSYGLPRTRKEPQAHPLTCASTPCKTVDRNGCKSSHPYCPFRNYEFGELSAA